MKLNCMLQTYTQDFLLLTHTQVKSTCILYIQYFLSVRRGYESSQSIIKGRMDDLRKESYNNGDRFFFSKLSWRSYAFSYVMGLRSVF